MLLLSTFGGHSPQIENLNNEASLTLSLCPLKCQKFVYHK